MSLWIEQKCFMFEDRLPQKSLQMTGARKGQTLNWKYPWTEFGTEQSPNSDARMFSDILTNSADFITPLRSPRSNWRKAYQHLTQWEIHLWTSMARRANRWTSHLRERWQAQTLKSWVFSAWLWLALWASPLFLSGRHKCDTFSPHKSSLLQFYYSCALNWTNCTFSVAYSLSDVF